MSPLILPWVAALALTVSPTATTLARSDPFSFKVFNRREGAPENTFYSLAVDEHQRLALGLLNGAARFNGSRFVRLDDGPNGGPRGLTVYSIEAGSNDRLWVATPSGLFARRNGQWTHLTTAQGLPHNGVNKVTLAAPSKIFGRDVVYVATQNGLAVLDADSLAVLALIDASKGLPESNIYSALELVDGVQQGLWIAGPGGVAHSKTSDAFRTIWTSKAEPERATRFLYLDSADNSTLWAGTESGLVRIDAAQQPTLLEDLRGAPVGTIVRIKRGAGRSWLCAARVILGVACLDDTGTWRQITVKTDVSEAHVVWSLAISGTANGADVLWMGSDAGLVRATKASVQPVTDGPPGLRQRIDALRYSDKGELWVTTPSDTFVGNGKSWQTWNQSGADSLRAVRADPQSQHMWVGTLGGTVYEATAATQAKRTTFALAADRTVEDIAFTKRNAIQSMWLAVNGGLWSLRGNTIHTAATTDGLPSLWVSRLLSVPRDAANDDLWVGFNSNGVARQNGERFEPVTLGFAGDENVTFMTTDRRGGIWVGLQAAGARRLSPLPDPTRVERFTESTETALPDSTVNSILEDARGRIYLCTNRGIARLHPENDKYTVRTFNSEDGMPDEECSMNAGTVAADGRLFFGTMRGLVFIDPEDVNDDPPPAKLIFEETLVGDEGPVLDGTRLSYKQNRLSFDYALVSATHGPEITYRTHLVGGESQPLPWRHEARREFTGLSSGQYEFMVTARTPDGREHGPIVRRFTITPPPWATPWAFAAYAFLGLGSAFMVARVRVKQLQARAAELEHQVEIRTEEIRNKNVVLEQQKLELEESYKQADLIFSALKEALPGKLLDDRYQLGQVLGEGGFGIVYRATEIRTGRIVAAKIFRPQAGNDSTEALERFKREAISGKQAKHPHAVEVIDAGVSSDGIAYIIMEMLTGRSLAKVIDDEGKISIKNACEIMAQTLAALAQAHDAGLIHRDIKPDNIFLCQSEEPGKLFVKVLDFGVAKALHDDKAANRSMTGTGNIVGTPTYVAPERLTEASYDGRSDVYACGIVLYEMIVGKTPFASLTGNLFSVIIAQINTLPPRLTEFDPSVPPAVQAVLDQALEKDPAKRPTAREWEISVRGLLAEISKTSG